jgi:hypothetical protein
MGDEEPPYDCNITIREQLERSKKLGLGALFVTNHNTMDGFSQMLQYKNDHAKFHDIQIYPAEEITTATGAHVLAYGIYKTIKPGLSLDEIIDEVKKQGGISSAPHPFGLLDALRKDSNKCDMIEIFNSNNVDVISNAKAMDFAIEHKMIQVAGSDSHVVSTLGRCINVIESENNLDDILSAMLHKKIMIQQTGYASPQETLEHIKYKINNSEEYLIEHIRNEYPNLKWFLSFLLKMYKQNPNSYLWSLFYKIAVYLMKRISLKINTQNYDYSFMKERNLLTMFKMAI